MATPRWFSFCSGRRLGGWLALALVAAWALAASGCAAYREDRCWVDPEKYALARDIFLQTGSLDLVQKRLTDADWQTGEINETLYRLRKEFEILPEGALNFSHPAQALDARRPAPSPRTSSPQAPSSQAPSSPKRP